MFFCVIFGFLVIFEWIVALAKLVCIIFVGLIIIDVRKKIIMKVDELLYWVFYFEYFFIEEGVFFFENVFIVEFMYVVYKLCKQYVLYNKVIWIIDCNLNIINVCIVNCKFCNFYWCFGYEEFYMISIEEY